ncbi:MAG: OmpA family protein [Nitrospira sp.]|jgi:chemotaxis protein MotB|nr:OmpA family protein [Nitrospira sp.]
MKNMIRIVLAVLLSWGSLLPDGVMAQTQETESVRLGEAALAYAAGSIQKVTPRDGLVNLITGDNQASGARTVIGAGDSVYLKLDNPHDVAAGDLFTVYRRVRKVFHPVTREYLGFITLRLAVVRVAQVDDALTTVEVVRSYGAFAPGDPVYRFAPPVAASGTSSIGDRGDIGGMIVSLQADPPVTLVAQRNVVYLDRGQADGLRQGDLLDIYRKGLGIPSRKVGQIRIISTEDQTATAQITKSTTRIMVGDRYKLVGHSAPVAQPAELSPAPIVPQPKRGTSEKSVASVIPSDAVARSLKVQDAAGASRLNLADVANLLRYESGEAAIRPEGYKVLDQLIEYLQSSGDGRMIRVEGHSDNREIGPSLKSRYPSNWELSKARANGVVRYLVEKGGVDSSRLSSMGYGDSRPAATNATEEGRTSNRRVEVVLYAPASAEPKTSQAEVPGQMETDSSQLNARGAGSVDAGAGQEGPRATPGTSVPSGQEALPQADAPGTPSLPASAGETMPDPPAQDSTKPSAPAL